MDAQTYNFTVDKRREGKRLDIYLVDILNKKLSRTFIKKMVDSGNVLVNGKSQKAHYAVNDGDSVYLNVQEPEYVDLRPEKIDLDILYEDEDVIVLNKPAGLVVHPGAGNLSGTLVNGLVYYSRGLYGVGSCLRPGIVHRLDKDTSGVLVVAKNSESHRFLSEQFKERATKRTYIALVRGVVQLDNGTIELPLGRHALERKKIGIKYADGKEAKTHYRVLERFNDFTVLELKLETGRTHQIRVHMAHTGHPLIGDKIYGSSRGMQRQALHAKTLGFIHPSTNKFMEFDTEIPGDMKEVIKRGRL